MRLHVVSLPHTHTTRAFGSCAFTEKVRKFCIMMHRLGHEVLLYAGEQNEAPCTEHVPCMREDERQRAVGVGHYTQASFDPALPHWRRFNARAISAIRKRAQPGDFLCLIGGTSHKPIADALPQLPAVEFGIGYSGTFARFRVFESYAWMHTVYGAAAGDAARADGQWFDAVIPSYFEPEAFPLVETKQDHLLFMARKVPRKGTQVVTDVAARTGRVVLAAGPGDPIPGTVDMGVVGPEERAVLMGNARALLMPTIYVEPFGSVVPEAMLCGTPAITTDWGAFTELVTPGLNGFRCRTLREFCEAVERVGDLNPKAIREHALARWSLDAVAPLYEAYFQRLSTLWDRGWYS